MTGDKHKKYAEKQTKMSPHDGRRFTPVQSIDMLDNYQLKKDTGGIAYHHP